jgi:hypothetical protein
MIAHARGRERIRPSILKSAVLVLAGTFGGVLAAAIPALLGSSVPEHVRLPVAAGLAVALGVLAVVRPRPWQFDVETPTRWLEYPGLWPPLLNGLVLGTGFLTRIGYWLGWLLPVLAFAAAGLGGVLIGAVYGFARLGASVVLAWAPPDRVDPFAWPARRMAFVALEAGSAFTIASAVLAVST